MRTDLVTQAGGVGPRRGVAMVTGGTRGIGRATVAELLGAGWDVSLGVRDASRVPAEWRNDARVHVGRFDALDEASPAAWLSDVLDWRGHADALVHAAGMNSHDPLADVSAAELERVWRVNTLASTLLCQTVLPELRRTGAGRVVLLSSMSGKRVRNQAVAYSESKFAVLALAHTIRQAAWDDGVRVCAVCPSFVATDMTAHVTKVFPDEMTPPDALAHLIRTVMELPNTASVAELLVNCRLEDMV